MTYVKNKAVPVAVLATVCLVPIVRWFFLLPLSERFSANNLWTTSLGQITGLLGMTLFAVNLILSSRSKILDKLFGGLDNFYFVHRWLGALSFALILFHPLFLVLKYLSISLREAALFFLPVNDLAMNAGIWALILMIALLTVTILIKIKYHVWRLSHKFMVFVFVIALVHVFLINSDISRDLFIRYYVLILSMLGLIVSIYRSFLRVFLKRDADYAVSAVRRLNGQTVELSFRASGEGLRPQPGQFVYVRFWNSALGSEPHPFSVVSVGGGKDFRLVIKSLGDFTERVGEIKSGTKATIEGPFGNFFGDTGAVREEVWLAGGIGITPFLSLARSLKPGSHRIHLYYCVSERSELVNLSELQDLAGAGLGLRLIPWVSKEQGRIKAEAVMEESDDLAEKGVYICGPSAFMSALRKDFISLGVDGKNIHSEEFSML